MTDVTRMACSAYDNVSPITTYPSIPDQPRKLSERERSSPEPPLYVERKQGGPTHQPHQSLLPLEAEEVLGKHADT